ncbi:MAG TPA: hypothetical protein VLG09_05125 [Candidatus Saccharimonadales bacterium]|nr:hypothetical protein [Candidatus Saccharimonadales bacterium]
MSGIHIARHGTIAHPHTADNPGTIDPIDHRPNDGSGVWPDSSNTGYLNEPNWPGSFTGGIIGSSFTGYTDYSPADGTTISYAHFKGKIGIASNGGDNITFVGCLFESELGGGTGDWCCYMYANTKVTFKYCTWKPSAFSTPPGYVSGASASTTNANSVAYGNGHANSYEGPITSASNTDTGQGGNAQIIMDRCEWWGCGGGCQFGGGNVDAAHPHTFTNNYIHDYADPWGLSGVANTYHHDGIGPDSDGGHGYVYIDHNTIASMGNTNAIALQGAGYHNITVTNNYISGWGLQLSIGASGASADDVDCIITDNITSGEIISVGDSSYQGIGLGGNGAAGPNYDNNIPGTAAGNTWRRNRWQVRSGDPDYNLADHGKYWWPTDESAHVTDYTG